MNEESVRQTFRAGLRPFVERTPQGPSYEDLAMARVQPPRPRFARGRTAVAAMVGLSAVAVVIVLTRPIPPSGFDGAAAARLGERFWRAVAADDVTGMSSAAHPDASLNYDGLRDLVVSTGTPLEIGVGGEVFGTQSSPQLCYHLQGPAGESRGSLVFREYESRWALWEVRTGTSACSVSSPSTTTTQPPMEFRMDGTNGFIRTRLASAFDEWAGEIAVVAMVPKDEVDRVNAIVDTLDELEATASITPDRVRELADEFVRGGRQLELQGDWLAIGLVPTYIDTPVDQWVRRLTDIPGVHAEQVDGTAWARTRIPDGWAEVAELPIEFESVWRGGVTTSRGILVITAENESFLVGYDGSQRKGEPVPERMRRWMSEARPFAVGHRVVYLTTTTLVLDIETLTWSEVPVRPVGRVLGSAVINGELYLVGDGSEPPVQIFDPDEMSWRFLDRMPVPMYVGDVATDGSHLYVAGLLDVFRYDSGTGWTELPDSPIFGQAPILGWADGLGLVVWNNQLDAAAFASGSWEQLPDTPIGGCAGYPVAHTAAGGMIVVNCEDAAHFDTSRREWTSIETPGVAMPMISPDGTALYVLAPNRDTTLLLRYDLDR